MKKLNLKFLFFCMMLFIIFCGCSFNTNILAASKTLKGSDVMITEWTIPTDNTQIYLPVSGTKIDLKVDWGDGSEIQEVTTDLPAHIYEKAGTYDIKIKGICPEWGSLTKDPLYSKDCYYGQSTYAPYTNYLVGVKQWGEINAQKYGFAWCRNLKYVSDNMTSNTFDNVRDMSYMFFECINLEEIQLDNFKTPKVVNMERIFSSCEKIESLNLKSFNTSKVENMSGMFENCRNLKELNLSNFDTSNVIDMSRMFSTCLELKHIELKNFDTHNVTNMDAMFSNCESIQELDISNFNTSKVTSMYFMFYNCGRIKELNLNNFDTSKVENMSSMFYSCSSLSKINLESFDVRNVKNMYSMFRYCTVLKELNLSNFNTENVDDMRYLFSDCNSLNKLYLSNQFVMKANKVFGNDFATDKEYSTTIYNMFNNVFGLSVIILTSEHPLENQFKDVKAQIAEQVIFIVPNKESEMLYEKAWTLDFNENRIKTLEGLAEDNSSYIKWKKASSWAESELDEASKLELIPIILDDKDLTKSINRKEFAAIAVKLYKNLTGVNHFNTYSNPFIDVNDIEVIEAYSLGITTGTTETTFSPDELVTREQMATMMTRTLNKVGIDTTKVNIATKFNDDAAFSDWASESIYFMSTSDIIKGVGENTFDSKGTATREQAIIIALRSYNKYKK